MAEIDLPNTFNGFVDPPLLWLDAKNVDGNDNTSINSSSITTWSDLSGYGHDVSVTDNSRSPTLNGSSVLFDGVDDFLVHGSTISTGDLTMVTVAQLATVDTFDTNKGGAVVSINDPTNDYFDAIVYREFDPKRFIHGSDNHKRFHAPEVYESQSNPILILDSSAGPTFKIYRNGNLVSSAQYQSSPKQNARFAIGNRHPRPDGVNAGNGYWYGSISEVLVFDKELSVDERIYLTAYLAKKWSMQGVVDSDDDGLVDSVDQTPTGP